MNEQLRPLDQILPASRSLGSIFADDDDDSDPTLATVTCGPHNERLPVANMPVREIRRRLLARFDIDPHTHAIVNGQPVRDDTVLRAGQVLMFMHRGGEKGNSLPTDL